MGSPALSVRIVIGALIIKERLGTSDEETVEQIREKCRLAIDILKTLNFILLLPIYNNVAARKLWISHPTP